MRKLVLGIALALLFTGCRVVITDAGARIDLDYRRGGVIQSFEPDRGPGAAYRVGEEIRFLLELARAGYVTLVVTDPDGRSYSLERDRWLPAGWNQLPPRGSRYRYTADYPTGRHQVTLYYASERGAVALTLKSRSGEAATAGIRVDQRWVTDRADTYLWVLP